MNWEVITWTCITVGVLIIIAGIIISIISALNVKRRTKELGNVHTELKKGSRILFAGGLIGIVKKIEDDEIEVELADKLVIRASRYSIQQILK